VTEKTDDIYWYTWDNDTFYLTYHGETDMNDYMARVCTSERPNGPYLVVIYPYKNNFELFFVLKFDDFDIALREVKEALA
jgi:hypothetical protein